MSETLVRVETVAMIVREWIGPPPRSTGVPGRRVFCTVGACEIERLYGGFQWRVRTGERMRRAGWTLLDGDGIRLLIPWPWGSLMFRVKR